MSLVAFRCLRENKVRSPLEPTLLMACSLKLPEPQVRRSVLVARMHRFTILPLCRRATASTHPCRAGRGRRGQGRARRPCGGPAGAGEGPNGKPNGPTARPAHSGAACRPLRGRGGRGGRLALITALRPASAAGRGSAARSPAATECGPPFPTSPPQRSDTSWVVSGGPVVASSLIPMGVRGSRGEVLLAVQVSPAVAPWLILFTRTKWSYSQPDGRARQRQR